MTLVKNSIYLVIIAALFFTNISAQIIISAEEDRKASDICGYIEDEQLNIPSYRFRIINKDGTIIKNLLAKGELSIKKSIYKSAGIFDFDPY